MASADLRQELNCSICLSIYTDPVTLRCGHNFCWVCIDRMLDTQDGSGVYTCPECRAECQERPALQRNITLCNIVEGLLSTQSDREESGTFCAYCVDSPVPAVISCLHCEASLCNNHRRVHSKSAEHGLCDPITSGNRKCPAHKKILEYYCTEDAACVCVSCRLAGEHRGHKVEMLDEASKKKKEKLRGVLQKLTTKRERAEKRVQSLQERRRDRGKAAGLTETITTLLRDIRRQLEDLEKRVLSEISRQEERTVLFVSNLIQQLEIKKDELSGKMRHIEELCNLSDPVAVLQEPDIGDLCDTEVTERCDAQVHGAGDLDVGLISGTLHILSDIITGINTGIYVQETTDLLLDVTRASNAESDIITGINTGIYVEEDTDLLLDAATAGDTESDIITGINTQIYVEEDTDLLLDMTTAGDTESDIITGINTQIYVEEATDLLMDVATASNNIHISGDGKTASWSPNQKRPETPERFQYTQVISTRGFSSGRPYWEVDVSKSGMWRVGMCYPSIDRRVRQSDIGDNKSWCLRRWNNNLYAVAPSGTEIWLPDSIPCDRVRVYLDYEAGQLSFYSLCDPIRHLHTYTVTFTEPLHAALGVWDGCVTISGGVRRGE